MLCSFRILHHEESADTRSRVPVFERVLSTAGAGYSSTDSASSPWRVDLFVRRQHRHAFRSGFDEIVIARRRGRSPIRTAHLFVCVHFLRRTGYRDWQACRGELFDWLRLWRTGIQLGPINMVPSITPKMQREARLFVLIFCVLVFVATLAALSIAMRSEFSTNQRAGVYVLCIRECIWI